MHSPEKYTHVIQARHKMGKYVEICFNTGTWGTSYARIGPKLCDNKHQSYDNTKHN